MKKFSLLVMFAALGIFSLGCEPTKPVVTEDSSDNVTSDTGEETPATPAADPKPEDKPADEPKSEDKPVDEPKPEDKPAEEPKPEEKPADEPKPEEKPAEPPKA
jgi:outer membrane biosynthesis protein TonB